MGFARIGNQRLRSTGSHLDNPTGDARRFRCGDSAPPCSRAIGERFDGSARLLLRESRRDAGRPTSFNPRPPAGSNTERAFAECVIMSFI